MNLTRIVCTLGLIAWGGCRGVAAVHEEPDPCLKWEKLADVVGCAAPARCEKLDADCEAKAAAMIDCAADQLEDCLCESDDESLNCEGAWKPSEGSAKCAAEHRAFEACISE